MKCWKFELLLYSGYFYDETYFALLFLNIRSIWENNKILNSISTIFGTWITLFFTQCYTNAKTIYKTQHLVLLLPQIRHFWGMWATKATWGQSPQGCEWRLCGWNCHATDPDEHQSRIRLENRSIFCQF